MIPSTRLRLGEFILCPLNQHLEYAEQRIPLEPKVYEVLCYLLAHQQRFVSLDELHSNVWQGRVVSDTAVRRTISKLRVAFNDQSDTPQYIQSAAKRGYRWLIPTEIDSAVAVTSAEQCAPAANQQVNPDTQQGALVQSAPIKAEAAAESLSTVPQSSAKLSRRSVKKTFFTAITASCLVLLLLGLFYWSNLPRWQLQSALPVTMGEKLSMTVSPDKRFLVFSSNAVNHFGQELYWYNFQSQEVKQLTTGDNQIMYVTYAADGKSLFYHNFEGGTYRLLQRSINEFGQFTDDGKVLLDNYGVMFKIWAHPDNESLWLNLGTATQFNIQRLHLPTGTLSPITSSGVAGVQDSIFAVALAHQQIAFQRFVPGQGGTLVVQDITSGRILRQFIQNQQIFDLHWLSAELLLIVDQEAIYTFNVLTEQRTVLRQNHLEGYAIAKGLSRVVAPLNTEQWLQFLHEGDIGRMIHQQGEIGLFSARSYIHTEPLTRAVFFSRQPNEFFVFNLQDNKRSLLVRHADGSQKLLFEIENSNFSFQQQHPDGSQLLLLLDGRPFLFDLMLHQLTALNVNGRNWLSARFSHDGQGVVMTSKESSQYQTWFYQLDTGVSQLVFEGYQVVLPYQDTSYVAVNSQSTFVLLEEDKITELPVSYSPPYPGSIHLRGTALFWAETDLKNTTIFRFNLETQHLEQWQQERRQMQQSFDISADGTQWLLRHVGQFDTKIYPVQVNF